MSTTVETATEMRPFEIEISDEQIADLRRRIVATRLPTKELVEDRSQGVQLATMRELGWDSGRIGRAWATPGAPRLHALRRPGGRRGRRHHGRDGAPSAQGVARHPPQLARGGVGHRRSTAGEIRTGTRGAQRARDVQDERLRLLPGAIHPATDDRLLPAGFTRRARGLVARP